MIKCLNFKCKLIEKKKKKLEEKGTFKQTGFFYFD